MKRFLCGLLVICIVLSGCGAGQQSAEFKQYNATFLTLFDTVTTVVGRAESQEAFTAISQQVHDLLLEYHQLFDIYNDYEGIHNLKTVNDNAGIAPVKVDRRIIDLLLDCKDYYDLTGGKVNVAMGSVLALWHEARTAGIDDPVHAKLPDASQLEAAAAHTSWDNVRIDEAASTVYLADPQMRLDVGAIAKGWSVQRVAEASETGLLISVGGNVCATGPKDASGTPWVVGVQNPDGGDAYLHTLYVTDQSVVTSGDYQRYYMVGQERYHHIIDPQTRMPAKYWRAVTIVCDDSGLADALSTAAFVLPLEEAMALVESCGAQAMWVGVDGEKYYSSGFEAVIRT